MMRSSNRGSRRSGFAKASRKPGVVLILNRKLTVAMLEIEIDQGDPPRLAISQMPREIAGQRCRADAAAGTDKRHHFPEL